MSKMQRDKGANYEREAVRAFRDAGMKASRNLTQARDGGHDLNTELGRFECKRRRSLAAYLRPKAGVRGVIARGDRGESLVVLRLADYLQAEGWLKGLRETLAAATEPPPGIRERVTQAILAIDEESVRRWMCGLDEDRVSRPDRAPPWDPGQTHFEGDGCPGGHKPPGAP